MTDRRFAAFDIDGTLIRWQLYHAVADELARRGHLDPIQYQAIRTERKKWKNRSSDSSFKDYERALVHLMDAAISGIAVEDMIDTYKTVTAEYKDQVYTYTRDLIGRLKSEGYVLFAVSASQAEIVQLLAAHYGFDDCAGSEYEQKDGYFTGQKHVLISDQKPIALKALAEKHGISFTDSIGVGDSESDIPMLASVERAIAFNPTRALYEHAAAAGWDIIVERKNVIYKIAGDGLLA